MFDLKAFANLNKLSIGTEPELDKSGQFIKLTNGSFIGKSHLRSKLVSGDATIDDTTGDITLKEGFRTFESKGVLYITDKQGTAPVPVL